MGAVALDLTPIVDQLLEKPFDRPAMDLAREAVGKHPHAYATLLRAAAKRTSDSLAAAYWLTEAARVHEAVDDLGGAIALVSRAWECDPGNPRTRELMAGYMARLAIRVGLRFEGAPAASQEVPRSESVPPPVETGLRPPPPERQRDTLPGLFGVDSILPDRVPSDTTDPEMDPHPESKETPAWARARERKPRIAVGEPSTDVGAPEEPPREDSGARYVPESGRVAPILPPKDDRPSPVDALLVKKARPRDPATRTGTQEIAPTRRSSDLFPALPNRAQSEPPAASVASAQPRPSSQPAPPMTAAAAADALAPLEGPATERPLGENLVDGLFEALQALLFIEDVREGADFVKSVLEEKFRPSAILVHLYDINSGHFVVASAHGPRAPALVDYATAQDEPLVLDTMKAEEPILVPNPAGDERLSRGRWLLVEPRRSVLCARASIEGRYLGLLEIADPVDGSPFGEDDGHALAYVASSFARFLDRRGIVLSDEPESDPTAALSPA